MIVVSDPFHMRQAHWMYKKVLENSIEVQMAPVPFGLAPYQRNWWVERGSQRYVRNEYIKFVFYLACYQISWKFAREWLASFNQY